MRKMVMALVAGAAMIVTTAASATTVRIDTGQLRGSQRDGVTAYLGIPYAAPPTGQLRWRAPQPPAHWAGVRDATAPAPACLQVRSSPTQLSPLGAMAEDCLFLNVWAPAGSGRNRPVMVWIHGGGFIAGAGSEAQFDGQALARRGVILVTLNYRLGRLGFFAHPALEVEQAGELHGNYGLLDQIAALRWVRRNIARFGGNPHNVTIFGQSAGGISVGLLAATDASKSLFHKAILMSGTPLQTPRDLRTDYTDRPSALTLGAAWAQRMTGTPQPTAAVLRAIAAERIAPAAPEMADVMALLAAAGPMVDGRLITDDRLRRLHRDGVAMPLIVGTTSRDSLVWSFGDGRPGVLPFWSPRPDQISAIAPDGAAILDRYATREAGQAASGAAALAGDILFGAGAFDLADKVAARCRSWLYRFDAVPGPVAGVIDGAPHGTELFYLFGTLDRFPYRSAAMTAGDRLLSGVMLDHFSRFAASGAPADAARWPSFTAAAPRWMLYRKPAARAVPVGWARDLRAIARAGSGRAVAR